MKYDFCGWATRNNLRCSDGRTIAKDAFKGNDGERVPLVWNHRHDDSMNVLGHALLENRDEGVYAYCSFNPTESGQNAKMLVQHGDITSLSIYANHLKQNGVNVLHGDIKEVSLVLAGANPGAFIESVISHGEDDGESAYIYTDEGLVLEHGEKDETEEKEEKSMAKKNTEDDETIQEIFESMTDKQKDCVYAIVGGVLENQKGSEDDEDDKTEEEKSTMKHNVFDTDNTEREDVLSHSEMATIISDGKRYGSLKESFLQHADEYGIEHVDYLFPDAKTISNTPEFIKRDTDWVSEVMNNVHHTPFSRIKSIFADITEDEARAKGYLKGNKKKDEVFSLLKRTTTPTTIYKKQKIDRDDLVDITDFDVIAWIKSEMRLMLDEEIARAILIGDGRQASSDDKINETCIRPIANDDSLYTITGETDNGTADAFIEAVIKARVNYKGSGTPTLFIAEDLLTEIQLLKDGHGYYMYSDLQKLASVLRVNKIVTVPLMKGFGSSSSDGYAAVIVNLKDYNVGADKGGSINMFDDFDIDYNQQKYLIETRCSGALIKPYSAIVFKTLIRNV